MYFCFFVMPPALGGALPEDSPSHRCFFRYAAAQPQSHLGKSLIEQECPEGHMLWGAPPPRPPGTSRHPASVFLEKQAPGRATLHPDAMLVKQMFWRKKKTRQGNAPPGRNAFIHICIHMHPHACILYAYECILYTNVYKRWQMLEICWSWFFTNKIKIVSKISQTTNLVFVTF